MSKGRVVVAMSGGVDSAVAAYLLRQEGYEVVGVTMRLWTVENPNALPNQKRCCSVEDVDDARRVCQIIGAPHYFLNFEREFHTYVVDYFCREYQRGRTPHPCIACNDKMKFDFLLQRALFVDAAYIATGHYARISHEEGRWHLLKGVDPFKDQSYVLFNLRQDILSRILFPVGWYPKEQIRSIATQAGLPVADKPDSQEICFIPSGDYRAFLGQRLTPQAGEIVDSQGNVLGQHPGVEFFTIGQRRGLGFATGERLFVTRVDAQHNRVVVGPEEELLQKELRASQVNYISGEVPQKPLEVMAKIRYKAPESPAILEPHGDSVLLRFQEPQRAVTPGQAVVFYQGDRALGGGFIEDVHSITTSTSIDAHGEPIATV